MTKIFGKRNWKTKWQIFEMCAKWSTGLAAKTGPGHVDEEMRSKIVGVLVQPTRIGGLMVGTALQSLARRYVSRGTGFRMVVACLAVPINRMCVNFVLDHTEPSSAHKIQVGRPQPKVLGRARERTRASSECVCVGFGHHPRCHSATTRLECEVSEELS